MDPIKKEKFEHLDPTAKALEHEWVLVGDYYYPKQSLIAVRSRMRSASLIKLAFIITPLLVGFVVAWLRDS